MPNRVARWILYLEEFEYTMEHRAGNRLKHVDALSRCPVLMLRDSFAKLMIENQNKDETIVAIKKALEYGEYDDYIIEGDILKKMVNGKKVIVVPTEMQRDVIRKVHEDGHFGIKKVEEIIKQNYYIPNLNKKVENYIKCCVPCFLVEKKKGKKEGRLNPIPKGECPLETYHIDHLGSMTSTKKGYNYLFVVVDAFSKFTWIYPVKTTNAREVVDRLDMQSRIGDPAKIISDRGSAFTSKEFDAFCEDRQIDHVTITTGVPRGNGQVERVNQIIISVLSKLSIDDPTKWYRHVDSVQKCLNSTYQKSIGTSPFQVLTGVKMRNRADLDVLAVIQAETIKAYDDMRDKLRETVRESIAEAQCQQKKYYDRNRKDAYKYQVDEMVAILRTRYGVGMKLRGKYLGPYRILKILGRDRYEVEKIGTGEGPQKTTTSADNMKRWTYESSEADD